MPDELERLHAAIDIHAAAPVRASVARTLLAAGAVLEGHFSLHRVRHAMHALRFRGVGRSPTALAQIVDALEAGLPPEISARLGDAKVLSPESAGFFLGNELARRHRAPLVICQTDMRRRSTKILMSGSIAPNDPVIIVNDVAGTGASLDVLRELAAERGGILVGAVLLGVIRADPFRAQCDALKLPAHWLVTGKWQTHTPDVDCPGCRVRAPLMPVAEFA